MQFCKPYIYKGDRFLAHFTEKGLRTTENRT